jgi:hypothetical protein
VHMREMSLLTPHFCAHCCPVDTVPYSTVILHGLSGQSGSRLPVISGVESPETENQPLPEHPFHSRSSLLSAEVALNSIDMPNLSSVSQTNIFLSAMRKDRLDCGDKTCLIDISWFPRDHLLADLNHHPSAMFRKSTRGPVAINIEMSRVSELLPLFLLLLLFVRGAFISLRGKVLPPWTWRCAPSR